MTSWTAFVGQVARLRRLIVLVLARARVRGRHVEHQPAPAGVPASGPPAHWVERVRQGAPGLLEPSLRSPGEPVRPAGEDIALPRPEVARPETVDEPEPEREPMAVAERELEPVPRPESANAHVRTTEEVRGEQKAAPPEVAARVRSAPLRKVRRLRNAAVLRKPMARPKKPLLTRVLRRKQPPAVVPPASVDPSATPPANDTPRELVAQPNPEPVQQQPDRPATALRFARHPVDEPEPRFVAAPAPVHDQPEVREHRSTVVEFEAPVAERRSARVERAAGHFRRQTVSAARPATAEPAHAERPVEDIRDEQVAQRVLAPPPPRPTPNVERPRESAHRRPHGRSESSVRAPQAPGFRDHDDPLTAPDADPWPELPAPLDHADDDVGAALRAWQRQRRLDREQTQL
jgi:hypothetical protein